MPIGDEAPQGGYGKRGCPDEDYGHVAGDSSTCVLGTTSASAALYKLDMNTTSIRWTLLSAASLLAAVLISLACGGGDDDDVADPDRTGVSVIVTSPTGAATLPPRRTFTPSPSPSATPLEVCSANPDPASPAALQVEQPKANAKSMIPVHVRGWSSNIGAEEGVVFVSIVDQKQTVLQANQVPPQPREFRVPPAGLEITDFTRPFAIDIVIGDVSEDTPFCIWVYLDVDEEGRAHGVVQVPIVIEPR